MEINPKYDCREADTSPLEMLVEAKEIMDRLAAQYTMLTSNKEVQQIYALIDGATFKLQQQPKKSSFAQDADMLPEGQELAANEDVDDGEPLTPGDMAKAVFNFLTSD